MVGAATASYTDNIADASLTGNSGVGTYHINTTSNFITVNSSKVFQADIKATILGAQAGINLNGGGDVALFGYQAGRGLITALETTMIGQMSGRQVTSGINQLFGYDIMSNLTTGSATGNVLVGHRDLWRATSAGANTVVGHDALYGAGTGSYTYNNNVSIGYQSGWSAQTVSNNTYLGFQSGFTNTAGNANVFLGYQAGYYETGSNKLFIDNAQRANESDARVKALMYGVFASTVAGQSLTVNGSLAVNSGASLTGVLTQTATLTAAGTTGAQTINKPSGSVNFAAGATTLVVTNSLVTAGSQIFLQVYGTDATARYATVTLGSGSFTITLNSAATGETKVGFRVDATQ